MSQLLKTLNEQRGAKLKEAQSIKEKAEAEKRGFTDDERNQLRGINDEVEKLNGDLTEEVRSIGAMAHQPPTLSKQEDKDVRRFDIGKLLRHMDRGGQGGTLDGIEAEMIQEGEREARQAGVTIRGIALPEIVTVRQGAEQRDMTVSSDSGTKGGELVATAKQGLAGDFYNATVLAQNGALVLTGLQGNVDLPRFSAGTDPAAKTENAAADETDGTIASLSLSPKRLPAFIDLSDQLLAQNSTMLEPFIRRELQSQMRAIQERAFYHGGGTNEPTGIANTSGIGSVAGGTNGAAPTWDDIVELEADIETLNAAMGTLHYITNSKVKKKLRTTTKVSSTDSKMIWEQMALEGTTPLVTNAVRSDLDKGNSTGVCSAIFYGNTQDFVIAYWGGLMLEMVRDTTGAKAGLRTLVANTYYDAGVLRPKSFTAMLDALTA